MKTKNMSKLQNIGQLTLDLHASNNAVRSAKTTYYDALDRHEEKYGRDPERINPRDPKHAAVIAATKVEYEQYQAAKRFSYNIQRRLSTRCQRFAW